MCGLLATVLSVASCVVATPARSGVREGFVTATVVGAFSCQVPSAWVRTGLPPGIEAEADGVNGLTVTGPTLRDLPMRIAVHRYVAGNRNYPEAERFVERYSRPLLGPAAGDVYSPVAEMVLAGRPALVFEHHRKEFVAPDSGLRPDAGSDSPIVYEQGELMARGVPVAERFVVLPAEGGFYVLRGFAREEEFPTLLELFAQVCASFRPLR